jgi:hypothetical protein
MNGARAGLCLEAPPYDSGTAMKLIHDWSRPVDLEEFLSRLLFAHLASASEEGPRESPVWFLWEDGAVWIIGSLRDDSFPRRIEREPRCAIGIVDFDLERGLVHHVGMRGRASVEPFDPIGRPGFFSGTWASLSSRGIIASERRWKTLTTS